MSSIVIPIDNKKRIRALPEVWVHRTPHRTWYGPLSPPSDEALAAAAVAALAPPRAPADAQEDAPAARSPKSLPLHVLRVLTYTDFRARYRAQALGVVWSLLNPLVMMGIMSLIFTQVFRSTTPHFSIFLLIGLIVWEWISNSISAATQTFVHNADVIKRTVFARQLLPMAAVLSYGINFCIELIALVAFIPIFPSAFRLSPALLLVPILLGLLIILLTGVALMTSVLNVVYRDVAYLVNTGLLLLYWVTPVIYPIEVIPQPYRTIMRLNPLAGILIGLRQTVMQGTAPNLHEWAGIIAPTLVLFGAGWLVFRHYERMVLDHV